LGLQKSLIHFIMVKVSVIIPCYNQGQYVDKAVDSILKQTFQDAEIIIVNDGSTDAFTVEKLTYYQKPRTTVIHTQNQGLAAARNTGIKNAGGEYILPLDADDVMAPTFLEQAVSILEQHPEIGVVSCGIQCFGRNQKRYLPKGGDVRNFLVENNAAVASLFRKMCWEQAGGYNEHIHPGYADWNFWIDITKRGWLVQVIPEYLFLYRRRSGSMLVESNARRPSLIKELVQNHKDLFAQYVDEILFAKEQELFECKRQKRELQHSASYQVGEYVLKPYQIVRHLLTRFCVLHKIMKFQTWFKRGLKYLDQHYLYDMLRKSYTTATQGICLLRGFYWVFCAKQSIPAVDDATKMRLLFIMPHMEFGGGEKTCLDLLSHLDPNRYMLFILTTRDKPHVWHDRFAAVTKYIWHPPATVNQEQIEKFITELLRRLHIPLVIIYHSRVGYALTPFIKHNFPHVKIVDLLQGGMMSPFIQEQAIDQNMIAMIREWQGKIKTTKDILEYSTPFNTCLDKRIAASHHLKAYLADKYQICGEQIVVIHNAVDTDYFNPERVPANVYRTKYGLQATDRIVSFIARLSIKKHPEFIVALAHSLRQTGYSNIKWVLAGDGEELDRLKQQIEHLGLQETVLLPGYIQDPRPLLKDTDVLVLPSEVEGLPVVILEAMSMGIPVVASQIGGIPELVEDGENGYVIPFDEHFLDTSARKIKLLLSDQKLYQQIAQNNRIKVQQAFSIHKMADQYDRLFKQLVSNKGG
jgi:glycosyltransferase involved in cell wall biosynthesis